MLATSSTAVDCGPYDIEFYLNDGSQTALNPTLFTHDKTVTQLVRELTTDYDHAGTYDIIYNVFYELYPMTKIE